MAKQDDFAGWLAKESAEQTGSHAWRKWPPVVLQEIAAAIAHIDAGGRVRKGSLMQRFQSVHGVKVSDESLDRYLREQLNRRSWTLP